MELLDSVKKVEAQAAKEVEKAINDSEAEVACFRKEYERKAQSKLSQALKKHESRLSEVRAEAEKEASRMLKDSGLEMERIRESSTKNRAKAVETVLRKIGG